MTASAAARRSGRDEIGPPSWKISSTAVNFFRTWTSCMVRLRGFCQRVEICHRQRGHLCSPLHRLLLGSKGGQLNSAGSPDRYGNVCYFEVYDAFIFPDPGFVSNVPRFTQFVLDILDSCFLCAGH